MILDVLKSITPSCLTLWQIQGALLVTSIWLVWRLWTFNILPFLRPNEPKEVPYLIPGHTIAFFTNVEGAIRHGIKFSRNSGEPFAISLLGIRFYILTSPYDVSAAYKNTATLSWDYYMGQLMSSFGLNHEALQRVWHQPQPGDDTYFELNVINPAHKSHVHFTEEMYNRQLLPGPKLTQLSLKVRRHIYDGLRWEKLAGPAMLDVSETHIQLSLKTFCRGKIIDMITEYMFGSVFSQIEPDLTKHMIQFNDDAWMVLFHYPSFMAPKLTQARLTVENAFKKYIKLPREQRADAMWGMQNIIAAQEQAGLEEKDRVALLLLVYWAAGSNAVNTLFWMTTYMLFYPELQKQIQDETQPAFSNGQVDLDYLVDHCPRLEAFFLEVLRMINGALGVRQVMETTEINGKILRPGNTLVIPFRLLHFSENVWGGNSEKFDPERFLKNPKLVQHSAFRPFGGGVSYCPGRFLVRHQVFGFVATFFHRFNVELPPLPLPGGGSKAQVFPKLDETTPSTGTAACVPDMDVIIQVSKNVSYEQYAKSS